MIKLQSLDGWPQDAKPGKYIHEDDHLKAVAKAVAAERERCATIADGQAYAESTLGTIRQENLHRHGRHIAATIAGAIRQEPTP